MSDQCVAVKEPPKHPLTKCHRCGCEFDFFDALKELFDAKIRVLDEGVFCVECMTKLSADKNQERLDRAAQDMTAVLERMREGETHDGHEKMIEDIVEALSSKDFRKQEYTYDTAVLCLSVVLLAETEMKRLTMRMDKFAEDEDKDYAVLVGRLEGLEKRLTGWLSDANDVISDLSVYSVKHSTIHRMDDEE